MIKLMLVAGNSSRQLADFLEQRGTFTVDFVFDNLYENKSDVLQAVIKVDKLVYVMQSETGDGRVRMDMQTLRDLVITNKFFKADEFVFLCRRGEENESAVQYFNAVVEDCNLQNAQIKYMDSIASFSSVYDNLIGVTINQDFKNHYRNLYRRSKGDKAKRAYEPTNDRELTIEPFDYRNLQNWEEKKKLAVTVEAFGKIEDGDDYKHQTIPNLSLERADADGVFKSGDLTVITGDKKAGKAVWATQFANSAVMNGKHTLFLDCSKSQRGIHNVVSKELPFKSITPWEYLHLKESSESCVCAFSDGDEAIHAFLRYVAIQGFQVFETIVLLCDEEECALIISLMERMISRIIAVKYGNKNDLLGAHRYIRSRSFKGVIAISANSNEEIESMDWIKQEFQGVSVVKPYVFKDYNNAWLYKKLGGA